MLTELFSPQFGRQLDQDEFLITVGATEALFCAIFGHVNPGDEVIIIEPYYNVYKSIVTTAGAVPVFVPLRLRSNNAAVNKSSDWCLDEDELRSKFNQNTKMIILNTPHNPMGKVMRKLPSQFAECAL